MLKQKYKNLLATIVYYDVQDYPLSTFEVWQYGIDFTKTNLEVTFSETLSLLSQLQEKKLIESVDGFWCLKNRKSIIKQRIRNQKISLQKLRKAKNWAKIILMVPFIRAFFVTGTLAHRKASSSSDWDVIVVLKQGRIWLGRLVVSVFLQLFGKRRKKDQIQDRFCLNHFITEDGLILEERNEYSAKEVVTAIPLFGQKEYHKFLQLNEYWIKKFLPNYKKNRLMGKLFFQNSKSIAIRTFFEAILEKIFFAKELNALCKEWMIKKIKNNPKTFLTGADIRYNDQSMVFLPKPQREIIKQKMLLSLTNLAR